MLPLKGRRCCQLLFVGLLASWVGPSALVPSIVVQTRPSHFTRSRDVARGTHEKKVTLSKLPMEKGVYISARADPKCLKSPFGVLPYSWHVARLLARKSVDFTLAFLVLLSCTLFAVGTVDSLSPAATKVVMYAEKILQFLFLAEYLLRWYSKNCRPSYLLKWYIVIDFLAFLPLLLSLVGFISNEVNLQFFRLMRILRIQRFLQDEETFGQFIGTDPDVVRPFDLQLVRTLSSICTLLFISSGLVYTAEHAVNPQFSTYFVACYFMATTLTTVGFGDIVPITMPGRAIICFSIMVGVAIIPLQLAKLLKAAQAEFGATKKRPIPRDEFQAILLQRLEVQDAQLKALTADVHRLLAAQEAKEAEAKEATDTPPTPQDAT